MTPDFPADARRRLVIAMLRDTLAVAASVPAVGALTVITPDSDVAAVAVECGADVSPEPEQPASAAQRLNAALASTAAELSGRGVENIAALQADLPAVRAGELAAALAAAPAQRRSLVTDHRGVGTSALIARGVQLLPQFGHHSADHHLRSGAHALSGHWPGLRLDVDTAEDLARAAHLGLGPATRALLAEIGWRP
ncbi:2-phospho-L-lactate guanylyltransferase [Skermania sp. ID1734]|nr:2-phospho-L-lactate guanylyltransferase [Skermania sp. ID1734]